MNGLDSEMWDREYQTEEEVEDQLNGNDLYEDDEEFYEDFVEEYDEEYDEDEMDNLIEEQSVMNNAKIRLDQGRLYNMLIEHSLFDGVEALPEALEAVESEIKGFIMERLEILLGMRAEKETQIQQIVQQPQFNDMEVQALKMMASKVTKGASASAPTSKPEVISELNTIKKVKSESKINTLSSRPKPKQKKKVVQKQTPPPTPQQNKKKVAQKPQRKLKKEMANVSSDGLTPEQIAKRDLDYVNKLKGMSIEDANKIVAQRHKRPVTKSNMTQEAVNNHHSMNMSLNETATQFGILLANAKKI